MKIIGTNQGQRGDLIIGTVVARAIKEKFPNSHFTLGINKQYEDMKELFYNHPYIDNISIWEGYDNWPTTNDVKLMEQFDLVLHPMPQHPNNHCWYQLVNHQTEASCIMNGLTPPKNLQCSLFRWFDLIPEYNNVICISPFTAWEKKNITIEKWQEIIDYIHNKGISIIQIGDKNEYKFNHTYKATFSYLESTTIMLSCKFLICLEGGMNWVASAYGQKVLGLMGLHYDGLKSSKLYQPVNPNAIYLESDKAENISNRLIYKAIDELLL